jgi:hypothetical protein
MRLISSALSTALAATLLASCTRNVSPSTPGLSNADPAPGLYRHVKPRWTFPASVVPGVQALPRFRQVVSRLAGRHGNDGGIYVSEFLRSSILGYDHKDTANNPPICTTGPVSNPNGIAVDGKGNLIDPDGGSRTVIVFFGPTMCGAKLGSLSDPFGQPTDASSPDAVNGEIAVGNIYGPSASDYAGGIAMCTLAGGCTRNLQNSSIYELAGVAMDNSGNCWADASNSQGTATLTYFAGCAGSGQRTTGFLNAYYGGMDLDKNGNLVTISTFDSRIYVYSGCKPACTLVGGPFPMVDDAVYGHLNKESMTLCTGDFELGQIDIYYYSPTAVTQWYSFNNGLSVSSVPVGCAYNPRSKQ